jgi:hypothetical protein
MSEEVTDAEVAGETAGQTAADEQAVPAGGPERKAESAAAAVPKGAMAPGDVRFGVTCTGVPIGTSHWLADSAVCGDMVMALPSSVLIAGRSKEAGGVAVDMSLFLDAIIEGAGKMEGLDGVASAAALPKWAVSRLFGTFGVLIDVYHEAVDQAVLTVEAAAMKAAIGMKVQNTRKLSRIRETPEGRFHEETEETTDKHILPDPALSKLILTSRMKGRYKDEGGMKQAIQINISGAEARL